MGVRNILKNKQGFTLYEVVLTIVLLSFGLVGGMTLFQQSTDTHMDNNMRVVATKLASQKIETIISDKAFRGYSYITNANYPSETLASPYSGYSRTTTITEVDESDFTTSSAGSGYKRADVSVSWNSSPGNTITVSTVVSDY